MSDLKVTAFDSSKSPYAKERLPHTQISHDLFAALLKDGFSREQASQLCWAHYFERLYGNPSDRTYAVSCVTCLKSKRPNGGGLFETPKEAREFILSHKGHATWTDFSARQK